MNCLIFDPKGLYLFSGSNDKTIKIWLIKATSLFCTLVGHDSEVLCLEIGYEGNLLISGSSDKTIKIWSTVNF